jgi:hypothetical protein
MGRHDRLATSVLRDQDSQEAMIAATLFQFRLLHSYRAAFELLPVAAFVTLFPLPFDLSSSVQSNQSLKIVRKIANEIVLL